MVQEGLPGRPSFFAGTFCLTVPVRQKLPTLTRMTQILYSVSSRKFPPDAKAVLILLLPVFYNLYEGTGLWR